MSTDRRGPNIIFIIMDYFTFQTCQIDERVEFYGVYNDKVST